MSSGATSGAAAKRKRPFQKVSASVPAKKSGASKRVVSSDDDDDDEIVPDSSPPSPARESVNKGKGMGNGKVGDKKKVPEESPGKKRQAGDGFATSSPRSKSPKKKETETPGRASAFGTSCSKSENKKPSSPAPAGQMAEVFKGKGNNKGYGSKGTKRKAVDPADAAGGKGDQASAKESLLPGDFLEMIAQAKREKEENEEIDRLRKEVEQQEGEASIAAAKNSLSDNKKRQPSAKPQSAQKQSRKEKKEATADWMEIYEESEGGMEVFNVAKDYLMAQLRKQGFDTHSILRQSGEGTYTDDFCKLMVEKKLGFKELNESEKQKLDKAAKEYAGRRRRQHTAS